MNINGLQLYRGKRFSGLTDQNNLANAFLTQPELVSPVISYIFGYDYNNPLNLLTNGLNRYKVVENRKYHWKLMGELEIAVPIIKNFGDGGSTPGIYGQTVRVVLKEKIFTSGEVLVLDDRNYPVIVVNDPYQEGDGFVYTLKLTSPDPQAFIPAELLEPGRQLSKDYSAFEEGSGRSGNTHYATPFELGNHLTTMRKSYAITGSAATDVMIIQMKDPKSGNKSFLWSDYQEWVALAQWYKEKERLLTYSVFNPGTIIGENGRPVFIGAGLLEQIAPANRRAYTKLTEGVIRDFLMDLSYNVLDQGQRKFVALCGEYFMDSFDKAMKEVSRGWQLVDTHFVTGSGQNLTFGGQFTTYKGLNGTEISLVHNPLYDNPVINRKLHPISGRPVESYRATFLDFGMYDGESNIQMLEKKDRGMVMWHTAGSVAPNGHAKSINTLRSNSMDGYKVELLSECGIMVKNPLSCGELYLDTEV